MSQVSQETALDLLEAMNELRSELRRLKRDGIVARLSDAEREDIARRVYERVDTRLAPADARALDDAPRARRKFGK